MCSLPAIGPHQPADAYFHFPSEEIPAFLNQGNLISCFLTAFSAVCQVSQRLFWLSFRTFKTSQLNNIKYCCKDVLTLLFCRDTHIRGSDYVSNFLMSWLRSLYQHQPLSLLFFLPVSKSLLWPVGRLLPTTALDRRHNSARWPVHTSVWCGPHLNINKKACSVNAEWISAANAIITIITFSWQKK